MATRYSRMSAEPASEVNVPSSRRRSASRKDANRDAMDQVSGIWDRCEDTCGRDSHGGGGIWLIRCAGVSGRAGLHEDATAAEWGSVRIRRGHGGENGRTGAA